MPGDGGGMRGLSGWGAGMRPRKAGGEHGKAGALPCRCGILTLHYSVLSCRKR
ncbi:Hypothetical protein GbCGDNIH2_1681 [Granulibacter bethesdensis]|uniref:Uncharacterized protein n=1 Tax=Granulibacter bethesdensis (strain ATCC BAA-1260 / CGDNIH1) TaxID=391165 RepID=Q0BRH3_GRABC|nr:Hypothetical protein GbCGDNIH1_1681 [Granulibacter bethesdensis CGDNIH1]APG30710.1 Hypothetical protein GbCGDNIH2_1681 [Granulibacter bethesdensis]APH52430.1 Hypothetical protein GbCGDNIH5_1681 [Granulibacter bethesdensis]APH65120.1 Hypothetical protein GbCGDNIH1I4_1681 [Granulibacter bethesdensis]